MKYYQNNAVQVKERVMESMERFSNTIFADFTQLYREHPFYDPPEMVEWFKDTLARPDFKEIFDLNDPTQDI